MKNFRLTTLLALILSVWLVGCAVEKEAVEINFEHITTIPCTEEQQKSGTFYENGERVHYVGCESWTITTAGVPYKGSMNHGPRLIVFKPKDN